MNIKEVWIQRSDFAADSFKENLSAQIAYDKFNKFPWREEVDRYLNAAHARIDSCPPGIGIVTKDGDILHIFATSYDGFLVSRTGDAKEVHVQIEEVLGIIKDFWQAGPHGQKGATGNAPHNIRNSEWLRKAEKFLFVTTLIVTLLFFVSEPDLLKFVFIPWGLITTSMTARAFMTGNASWGSLSGTRKASPILFWFIVVVEILFTVMIMGMAIIAIIARV